MNILHALLNKIAAAPAKKPKSLAELFGVTEKDYAHPELANTNVPTMGFDYANEGKKLDPK